MSTTEQKTQSTVKDIYGVYQQNVDKLFDGIRQQVPRYHQ